MNEWRNQRHLKSDLLTAQRGCAGYTGYQVESTRELLCGLDQRRALQRPLSCLAPPFDGRFDEPGLSEVMRQQLRRGRAGGGKIIAQGFADAAVQDPASTLK